MIFNLSKDTRSSDVLIQADWHPLNYCYKLVLLKLMHKAFHDELPQVLSDNIVMNRPTGYSLQDSDSLTVPCFNSIYELFNVVYICVYVCDIYVYMCHVISGLEIATDMVAFAT